MTDKITEDYCLEEMSSALSLVLEIPLFLYRVRSIQVRQSINYRRLPIRMAIEATSSNIVEKVEKLVLEMLV